MSATKAIWSGPGIIQGFLNLRAESKLTQETLEKWLDEEYIPAMLETKIIRAAQRYKAANPEYLKQNMVVYELADLASAKDGKLQEVPRSSNLFPSSDPVDAFVESEARILCFVEEYKKKEHDEDAAKTIIYAAMEPGVRGEADLDAWYREEHNEQMSLEPGWIRTNRYEMIFNRRNDGKDVDAPSFLAIHEFGEGNNLGKNVEPLTPITDWTKRCMADAKAIDATIYQKVKSFGE